MYIKFYYIFYTHLHYVQISSQIHEIFHMYFISQCTQCIYLKAIYLLKDKRSGRYYLISTQFYMYRENELKHLKCKGVSFISIPSQTARCGRKNILASEPQRGKESQGCQLCVQGRGGISGFHPILDFSSFSSHVKYVQICCNI